MSVDSLLSVTVWPVYVALGSHANDDVSEDKRFPITWATENGMTVGHAQPLVGPGEYQCLLYFHAPTGPPTFSATFAHPFRVTTSGRQSIGPILYVGDEITAEVN